MDDQNEGLRERWGQPGPVPERGYATDEPGAEPRTAEIRSDIEQTRADMTETIDAIQEKLKPSTMVSNATESVRNATVGKVKEMARSARNTLGGEGGSAYGTRGYGVMERIREHPVPAALAAVSVAWIALSGRRQRHEVSPAIYGSTQGSEPFVRETVISEYDDDRGMSGEYDRQSRGGEYDAAGVARRAQSAARDTGQRVRRATSSAQQGIQRFVRDNPLAAAGIAVAAGATLGASLPKTRRENELMGETRDAVVDRAQEAARGAAERVQDAAQRVEQVAGEAVRKTSPER